MSYLLHFAGVREPGLTPKREPDLEGGMEDWTGLAGIEGGSACWLMR